MLSANKQNQTTERTRANGSSYQGKIVADYQTLVDVFGEPYGPSADGKVQVEWVLPMPEGQEGYFTIYDYKNPVQAFKNREWHVGGKSRAAVDIVMTALLMDADVCGGCGFHVTRCRMTSDCRPF